MYTFFKENQKKSLGSQAGALNIWYFFLTNQVENGYVKIIHYCPTCEMVADYLNKPLQGKTQITSEERVICCNPAIWQSRVVFQ
jgi:hypothetical protein